MKFTKHDSGKRRFSLIPAKALNAIIDALEYGAQKYDDNNWAKCEDPKRYWDAAQRHLWAWLEGETHDQESGLHHLAHAGVNIMFLYALTAEETADEKKEQVRSDLAVLQMREMPTESRQSDKTSHPYWARGTSYSIVRAHDK